MELKFVIGFLALVGLCFTQECNKADVVFLLDESSSIQPQPFSEIKQFVFDVIDAINIGPGDDKSHLAVMMFATVPQILFRFNILDQIGLNRTKEIIEKRVQVGGSTHTYKALDLIRRAMYKSNSPGHRPGSDVARITIVITDGNSQLPDRTKENAARLRREAKVHVFAIGVGNETKIRQEELENIASDKASVFRVKDAAGLNKIKNSISGAACAVEPEEEEYDEEDEEYQWVPTEGPPEEYAEGDESTISET